MKNDRIKLALKCILISIPLVLIIIFAAAAPMGYMTQEYVLWKEELDYVNQSGDGSSMTLIIGDSRAKSSVIPEMLEDGDDIYNIGIGGATSIEMYYAVKNYIYNHGAPEQAVVIFAPYHFCDIDNWDQTLFTNYLSIADLAEVYKYAAKFNEEKIDKKGALSDVISFKLRLPSKYLAQMYEERFFKAYDRNYEKYNGIRSDKGYCEFGSDDGNDGENYEVHHEYFDHSDLVLFYYDRLLSLLNDSGTEVYILQAPINEASAEAIHPEFIRGYDGFLEETGKKFPDIRIMKDIPVYENRYFGDNNHLNRRGAEKYTARLKDDKVIGTVRETEGN